MSKVIPFEAVERTLPNQLRVIVVPTGFPNLVSVQIPVQTGSRNEVEPGKSGFAHFFEHMMFRGTKEYPPERYHRIVTRMGARQNAYTTDDYTNYHITLAAEDLAQFLEMEADRFMNLEYSEDDFRTESRAILGEYNKSSAEPLMKLLEVQREHAYTTHTYQHTTMGFLRDIEDMPNQFDYSRIFFDRWYRPEYTSIIVAGDVEPQKTVKLVERHWGGWRPGTYSVEIPQEPSPAGPILAEVEWASETLPWVTVAFHGPAFSTTAKDYAAIDLLLDLHFGPTSDLYRKLVEREQVVDQFFPYFGAQQDPSLGTVMARVKDVGKAAYVRDAILETLAAARSNALAEQKVKDAQSYARYAFVRALDNSESIAGTLARFVRFERRFDTVNELYELYDTLESKDLLEAGQRYITDERLVQTTLSTRGTDLGLSAPGLPPARSTPQLEPGQTIKQASASPLVIFKLQFPVGSAHDPAGKEGLATLAASMITEAGSERLRIDEITDAFFPMAASFSALVDRETTTFTGTIHRDLFDRFAGIALEQLTSPGYREEDFRRLREMQRNDLVLDLRSNNDEELGKERLQQMVFDGTGYAHPTLGTVAGVDSVTLDDVRSFHAERYSGATATLAISGAFTDQNEAKLSSALASLAATRMNAVAKNVVAKRTTGLTVDIVQKETRATAISVGHAIDVRRGHPDWVALWLARAWLGEHRAQNGRLFQRIREVRGLNYGNYAYIEAFPGGMYQFFPDATRPRSAQLFEMWLRPMVPETAVFGLKIAIYELRKLLADGISADEFEETRDYLAKNVYQMCKTQDQQLGYALDSAWYGTPIFVDYVRNALAGLSVEKVNAAVRRHLSGEDLFVACVTSDAETLRAQLLSREPTAITYDSPKPVDVVAEDAIIGSIDLGLTEDRVTITPVDEVFAR